MARSGEAGIERPSMDSITQLALGAAVGEAALGHRVGRKAALWGGICGTLPDLDVLIPFGDPVADFTYHRSFSHSLLVLALLTPLLVWLIRRIHPRDAGHRAGWYALVYLAFATHVVLDSCTIYGTQIFWPLDSTPMTWGSVFIIDPAFTLPLIVGLIAVALARRNPMRGYRINAAMLALSTLYLGWSFAAKFQAQGVARESLAAQGRSYERIVTLASPFNTILWRIVAMDGDGYHVGWYSLLDGRRAVEFTRHASDPGLLGGLEDHWPVNRLQWFTKGFYRVSEIDEEVVMTDLRMGVEGSYVFRFSVGIAGNPHSLPRPATQLPAELDTSRLPWLWARIRGLHEYP
jgi:inner membrane protein